MASKLEKAQRPMTIISMTVVVLGTLAVILDGTIPWPTFAWGIYTTLVGVFLAAVMTILAFNIDVLEESLGGKRYEKLRRHGQLRTGTILLRSFVLVDMLLLLGAVLVRMDVIQLSLESLAVRRATMLLFVGTVVAAITTHRQALHVPVGRDRSDLRRATMGLLLVVAVAAAASSAYMTATGKGLLGGSVAYVADAPIFHLFAGAMLATAMAMTRGLPGLGAAILDPGRISAGGYNPGKRGSIGPTVVAFTVLGGFMVLLVLFSAGILNVLQTAGESGLVFIALLIMLAAIVAGIVLSMQTGRQEDRTKLYRKATKKESHETNLILGFSIPAAVLFGTVGIMLSLGRSIGPIQPVAWMHFAAFAVLVGVGPYGFYAGKKANRIRQLEQRFPDLLRDLASSHKGGLTLAGAVQVSARGDYGALSPEVEKMADQLTWNVSFDEALDRMSQRVRTPLVQRTISLILEASRNGGNTSDVLMAAARDARELTTLERQRRVNMSVYSIVIYVVFFVFLFVIGVLYAQFVPEILRANEASKSSQFENVGALDFGSVTLADYQRFYFTGGLVQAMGNGILAGVMGNGSPALGLRHAFIMTIVTYITFGFLL